MLLNLLFATASLVGGDPLPPASQDGVPIPPNPPVVLVVEGHKVTTGAGEVETMAARPPETEESYHYRLCLELQEVKPYIDWTCVQP